MVRRPAQEAEKTRAGIVDSALFVFAERGVHAAQLEEIAQRAGVTRGALYHHFSGKPDLLSAVLKERWQAAMDPVLEPLRTNIGEPAIRAFVERFLECVDSDLTVRALLKLSLSGELGALEPSGGADKAKAFSEWLELLDRSVAAGKISRRDVRIRSEGVQLSFGAGLGACRSSFDNDVLLARADEFSLSLSAAHVWDFKRLSLSLGAVAGADWLHESFETRGHAPPRDSLGVALGAALGASAELTHGFYAFADAVGQVLFFEQRRSDGSAAALAKPGLRLTIGAGKLF